MKLWRKFNEIQRNFGGTVMKFWRKFIKILIKFGKMKTFLFRNYLFKIADMSCKIRRKVLKKCLSNEKKFLGNYGNLGKF